MSTYGFPLPYNIYPWLPSAIQCRHMASLCHTMSRHDFPLHYNVYTWLPSGLQCLHMASLCHTMSTYGFPLPYNIYIWLTSAIQCRHMASPAIKLLHMASPCHTMSSHGFPVPPSGFKYWLNQFNNLIKLYLSLFSLAFGITKIWQGTVEWGVECLQMTSICYRMSPYYFISHHFLTDCNWAVYTLEHVRDSLPTTLVLPLPSEGGLVV